MMRARRRVSRMAATRLTYYPPLTGRWVTLRRGTGLCVRARVCLWT
jgi:hypothetical protein